MLLILGNQLFPRRQLPDANEVSVFMCEDMGLCTDFRHHQQKIVLFLSAMRSYAEELGDAGYEVAYVELDPDAHRGYEDHLADALDRSGATRVLHFEIEDRPMESRIVSFAEERGLERKQLESPMFRCSRERFAAFARDRERVSMAEFYKSERRRLEILVDADGEPAGGRWSFDEENRKKLPQDVTPPAVDAEKHTRHTATLIPLVRQTFGSHPGDAREFWWPTTRRGALAWLRGFLDWRLERFGPYEDAISTRSDTMFHSLLSPLLNLGLITPEEVVERVLEHAEENDIPLASTEGFIRQVIGWREFVRGIYREFGERQAKENFWNHDRKLTDAWYEGSTGIPVVDDTIRTAKRLGWTHHIPRLMVMGNMMTLCEIEPKAAHDWFMEMYVDSSEWVMGPNVYGMGIFSDGGIFATKPYICGSNYLRKMSDYGKGDWCDTVDGLYWRFIDRHRDFFETNPRLALMPRALDRLDDDRREAIFGKAAAFLGRYTKKQSS
ncbi:MAG: cryptochrome/photolyase family protein [Woeseia sp.]